MKETILKEFSDIADEAIAKFPMPENGLLPVKVPQSYKNLSSILDWCIYNKELTSERVLKLSKLLIGMNPVNYVAFGVCQQCLNAPITKIEDKNLAFSERLASMELLFAEIKNELDTIAPIGKKYLKNYQLWAHRYECLHIIFRAIYVCIDNSLFSPQLKEEYVKSFEELIKSECNYSESCLTDSGDPKNYHCWDYRIKIVKEYLNFLAHCCCSTKTSANEGDLIQWNDEELRKIAYDFVFGEEHLRLCTTLLEKDTRNNSAWSYLMTSLSILFEALASIPPEDKQKMCDTTARIAEKYCNRSPMNESSWNFIFGFARFVANQRELSKEYIASFIAKSYNLVTKYASPKGDSVISPYAVYARYELYTLKNELQLLTDEEKEVERGEIISLFETLETFDNIRTNWWKWLKEYI